MLQARLFVCVADGDTLTSPTNASVDARMIDLRAIVMYGCVGKTVSQGEFDVDSVDSSKVTSLLLVKCSFAPT